VAAGGSWNGVGKCCQVPAIAPAATADASRGAGKGGMAKPAGAGSSGGGGGSSHKGIGMPEAAAAPSQRQRWQTASAACPRACTRLPGRSGCHGLPTCTPPPLLPACSPWPWPTPTWLTTAPCCSASGEQAWDASTQRAAAAAVAAPARLPWPADAAAPLMPARRSPPASSPLPPPPRRTETDFRSGEKPWWS
jgi:hypothetical protein